MICLTKNGPVDNVSIGKAHFDGMLVVLYVLDDDRHVLVDKDNVPGRMQSGLERELSIRRFVLQNYVLPLYSESSSYDTTINTVNTQTLSYL